MTRKLQHQSVSACRTASTIFAYRTAKGAMFLPGEYHSAVCNDGESLYNLTHKLTGEIVTFCQHEVIDPHSSTRGLDVQQACATELLWSHAQPGRN
jgi:hypothetical protein